MSHLITTTKVVKNIDPLDVSAYKMKMIYDTRKETKKVRKPCVGNSIKMYEAVKNQSLFPSVFNKEYLLGNM